MHSRPGLGHRDVLRGQRADRDLSALRFIATVGEPLNPEVVEWTLETFGRPAHDNWWQTETGGIMIFSFAACEIRPGSMDRPLPGIDAAVIARDAQGRRIMMDGVPLCGLTRVTACFFGEGAVAEGEFHESLNLAALWRLPVLFCCETNLYAMGTALSRSESETDIALKASAYEVPAWPVDGMDVHAVRTAAHLAVDAVRGGGGPHLLELRTYRFRAHSMYGPERYRERDEVRQWQQRDPITLLPARLCEAGDLDDAQLAAIEAEIGADVDAAVAYAEAGHDEPVEDLLRFVHTDGSLAGAALSTGSTTCWAVRSTTCSAGEGGRREDHLP